MFEISIVFSEKNVRNFCSFLQQKHDSVFVTTACDNLMSS